MPRDRERVNYWQRGRGDMFEPMPVILLLVRLKNTIDHARTNFADSPRCYYCPNLHHFPLQDLTVESWCFFFLKAGKARNSFHECVQCQTKPSVFEPLIRVLSSPVRTRFGYVIILLLYLLFSLLHTIFTRHINMNHEFAVFFFLPPGNNFC